MTRDLTRAEVAALSADDGPTGADFVDPPRRPPTRAEVLALDERVPDPWADEAAAMRERIRGSVMTARARSPRATPDDVEWTENSTTWHATPRSNRWMRALCGTRCLGDYGLDIVEHPGGPPRSVQGTRRICGRCLDRVAALLERAADA